MIKKSLFSPRLLKTTTMQLIEHGKIELVPIGSVYGTGMVFLSATKRNTPTQPATFLQDMLGQWWLKLMGVTT